MCLCVPIVATFIASTTSSRSLVSQDLVCHVVIYHITQHQGWAQYFQNGYLEFQSETPLRFRLKSSLKVKTLHVLDLKIQTNLDIRYSRKKKMHIMSEDKNVQLCEVMQHNQFMQT